MMHDLLPPEHKCSANFVVGKNIIPDCKKTRADIRDSFYEFILGKINVFPYENFTLSIEGNDGLFSVFSFKLKDKENLYFNADMFLASSKKTIRDHCDHIGIMRFDRGDFFLRMVEKYNNHEDKYDYETAFMQIFNAFACAIMIINSQHVEREPVVIAEKLNKSRAKSGKPALKDYIVIKLTEETKRRLCETVNGEKVFRRPHWRRGHLRHLGDGRIVPVSACIVNFNGEHVDPKLYVVKA